MKRRIALSLLLMVGACGGPAKPPAAPASTVPAEQTGTPQGRIIDTDMVCGTANEAAQAAYSAAHDAVEAGDDATGEAKYREAIERDPRFCDAMDNLGLIYRRHGRVEEAIELYRRSMELAPKNYVAHQNLAAAYLVQQRWDDAIAVYNKMIALDKQNPEGWFGLGLALISSNRPHDAIEALRVALALYEAADSPLAADAHYLLGIAFGQTEQWKEARDHLEPLYDTFGGDAGVNLYLGLAYLSAELKDLDKARAYLTRAKKLGARVPEAALKQVEP